ncbi:schwannomin-interacting protein 1 isoform X2 [Oryzias latipes]|nr:schwannomin-interacting protein 1 isoform X2 [Oryzias latipes]
MHWEALSLRIAELEKQEEERKAKAGASAEQGPTPANWAEERGRRPDRWEDGNDACNSHVLALTSRLQTQMNLQLCFINNSESEEEEEEKADACNKESNNRRGKTPPQKNSQHPAKPDRPKARGFRNTLRNLRDRLRADHKTPNSAGRGSGVHRKHLERSDVQSLSMKDLNALRTSLSQAVQDLSAELVSCLHIRDQLRTEQDAMLLEVQDLTSL